MKHVFVKYLRTLIQRSLFHFNVISISLKVPISPKILHFYMNLGSAMNNLRQKKIRSEAFLYFFYAVKDAKKRHFRLPVLTMTEQGRSIRSLGCDVRGVTCCRVLESYDC